MVATQREVVYEVDAAKARGRYRRSEPPPPYTYAITLEVEEEGDVWPTVRLWDNADDVNEHHVHEYTRQDGKQMPLVRHFDSVNGAMAVANAECREKAAEIVRHWWES